MGFLAAQGVAKPQNTAVFRATTWRPNWIKYSLERMSRDIEKIRHCIPFAGFIWEVDEFKGENQGLLLAEIELAFVGQDFEKPPWIGQEVTGDIRYYNANLVRNPFSTWKK